jgi:hypothetical protein
VAELAVVVVVAVVVAVVVGGCAMIPPVANGRGSVASRRHWSRALSWSWS